MVQKETVSENNRIVANPLLRNLIFLAGWFFVFLAFIGILLPLVPTTPFLLLAAACFYRSSGKFYKWIMQNKLFGHYLQDYKAGRGIPPHVKVTALLFTWTSTLVSAFFFLPWLWLRILVIGISIAITVHLAMVKTRR
jgi:uncharacterized membrane protein YbaN (DUF454 family)